VFGKACADGDIDSFVK